MENTKFTPGPWFSKGKKVFHSRPVRDLPKNCLWNGTVCICASTEDEVPEAEEEARYNARLIARGPDMYGELKFAARHLEFMADHLVKDNAVLASELRAQAKNFRKLLASIDGENQ